MTNYLIHRFFQMAVVVTGLILLLAGSGLYFSARFKHTTTAVVMNFALVVLIWGFIPLAMTVAAEIANFSESYVDLYCNSIPFVQAVVVMDLTASGTLEYTAHWPSWDMNFLVSTLLMLAFMMVNVIAGLLFAWGAKSIFRRKIF